LCLSAIVRALISADRERDLDGDDDRAGHEVGVGCRGKRDGPR